MKRIIKRAALLLCCAAVLACVALSLAACGEGEGYAKNPKKDIPLLCDIINAGDLTAAAEKFFEDANAESVEELPDLTLSGEYNGKELVAVSEGGFISLRVGNSTKYYAARDGYFATVSPNGVNARSYLSELDMTGDFIEELLSAKLDEIREEHLSASDGYYAVDGEYLLDALSSCVSDLLYDYIGGEVSAETIDALADVKLFLGVKDEKLGAVLVSLDYDRSRVGEDKGAQSVKDAMSTVKSISLDVSLKAESGVLMDKLSVELSVSFRDGSEAELTAVTSLTYGEDGEAAVTEHSVSVELKNYYVYSNGGELFAPRPERTDGYYGDGEFSVSVSMDKRDLSCEDVLELSASYKLENIRYFLNNMIQTSGEEYETVNGKTYSRELNVTVGEIDLAALTAKISASGETQRAGESKSFTLDGDIRVGAESSTPWETEQGKIKDNYERLIAECKRYYNRTKGSIYPHSTAGHPYGYYAFRDAETGLYVCYSRFIYSSGESTPENIYIVKGDPTLTPPIRGAKFVIVTLDGDKVVLAE